MKGIGTTMRKRTLVQFHYDGDIWPIIEKWASDNGYRLKDSAGSERSYQKGVGFLVAPMMLRIKKEDQEIALEAWIRVITFVRMRTFFILPPEMPIESGGFRGVGPRRIARKAVNKLLNQLRQSPIP